MTMAGAGGSLNGRESSEALELFDGSDSNARQVPLSCIGSVEVSTALVPVPAAEPQDVEAFSPPSQADSDRELVRMWVARSASPHTRRNYRRHADRFLA